MGVPARSRSDRPAEFAKGHVAVPGRFRRQAQHPLTQDVALHLVRSAGDAVADSAEQVLSELKAKGVIS